MLPTIGLVIRRLDTRAGYEAEGGESGYRSILVNRIKGISRLQVGARLSLEQQRSCQRYHSQEYRYT